MAEGVLDDGTEVFIPMPETWSDSDAESAQGEPSPSGPAGDRADRAGQAISLLGAVPGHGHSERALAHGEAAASLNGIARLAPASGTAAEVLDGTGNGIAEEAFLERFAAGLGRPAVLTGVPEAEGWPAATRWRSQADFLQHHGRLPVQVTEMSSIHGLGKPFRVELTLEEYAAYAKENDVDWPFYVWERNFQGERRRLLDEFSSPKIMADDLYDLTPEVREFLPLSCHLFVLVGGRRTGSNMHKDPKWSSAWNTLLCGKKRWVMFPRDVPASEIGALEGDAYKDGGPQAYWWLDHYTRLRAGRGAELGMVDILQNNGDTVFIPAGWWHATLNLPDDGEDVTVACTRNVFPAATLPYVLPRMRDSDPAFATTFVSLLRQLRPEALRFLPENDEARASAVQLPEVVGECESWQVRRRSLVSLSLAECRRDFIRKGRPLIITGLGPHLVSKESCNLSRDFLSSHFGEKMVAVYRNFCDPRLRNAGGKDAEDRAELMRLREALQHLQKSSTEREGLYIYDLSLPLQLPGLLEHVRLPRFFTHCYLQQTMRQHCFSKSWPTLFIGAKGSQAKLHVDQWHGHFWMYLVSGRKRWTIWHPDDAHLLRPVVKPGKVHPTFPDLADLEEGKIEAPGFREARRVDVVLEEGETLFVPGGAPHLVVNITDSVAVAGNFLDESNFEVAMADMRAMAAQEAQRCSAGSGAMGGVVSAIEEIEFDPDRGLHEAHLPGRMLAVRYRDFAGGIAAGWGPEPPQEDDTWELNGASGGYVT